MKAIARNSGSNAASVEIFAATAVKACDELVSSSASEGKKARAIAAGIVRNVVSDNGKAQQPHILDLHVPDIPAGAKMIGQLPQGSAIFALPSFAQYIVFHAEYPPKIITFDGKMVLLDTNAEMVLK